MTSSVAARTASNSPVVRASSTPWRNSTSDMVWRVTSPLWPQPASSSWASVRQRRREGGRLGVEVHLRTSTSGPPRPPRPSDAVDQGDGAPDAAGQFFGRARRRRGTHRAGEPVIDAAAGPAPTRGSASGIERHQRRGRRAAGRWPAQSGTRRRPPELSAQKGSRLGGQGGRRRAVAPTVTRGRRSHRRVDGGRRVSAHLCARRPRRRACSRQRTSGTAGSWRTHNGTGRCGAQRGDRLAGDPADALSEGSHRPHRVRRTRGRNRERRRPPQLAAPRPAARAGSAVASHRPSVSTVRPAVTLRRDPWPARRPSRPWRVRRSCSASPTSAASSTSSTGTPSTTA